DGTWWALQPVHLDTQAHTISALVPDSLTAPVRRRAIAAGTPSGRIVVKWTGEFFMVPKKKSLTVNEKLTLTPYARGLLDTPPPECTWEAGCVFQPAELTAVPFTNSKPGFLRSWYVDSAAGGDATVGMVMPTGDVGAQYTAPAKQPDPATVT